MHSFQYDFLKIKKQFQEMKTHLYGKRATIIWGQVRTKKNEMKCENG